MSDQKGPKGALKRLKDRLWTALGRFSSDFRGSEVLRASAGPSRGALLLKSTFFSSVADFYSIWPLPRPLRVALGLPLGALWGPLAALGVPLGLPKVALGPSWGPFWGAFGSFWVTFRPLKAPMTHQGPIWELYWLELASFFMIFQAISACNSACTLAFAKVCVTRSALFPAHLPTGLVAVWASPIGYIVNLAERKLPQTITTTTSCRAGRLIGSL